MLDIKRQIKDSIYEQLARTTKALGHPKRIEILDLLSQGEKTVEAIAEELDLGIKNASAQLKELKQALLVDSRREGKFVYYRVFNQNVMQCLSSLRAFGEAHFYELQKITEEVFGRESTLEAIDRKKLINKVKNGEAILLDVRPKEEFEYAHIPYAMSIPIGELNKKINQLPKNKEIIAYCRGPYCFLAKEAVEALRKKGFKALRLKDSVTDWESSGQSISKRKVG